MAKMQTMDFGGVKMALLDPKTLTANPLNYQKHPEKQKAAISASIKEFGWVAFPIYNSLTNRLIDGHARVEDAIKAGTPELPCVIVYLTETQEKRLLASFDRIGRMATQDDSILARLLQDCADDGPMPAGWTEDELGDLLLKINKGGDEALQATAKASTAGAGARAGGDDEDEDETPVNHDPSIPASQIRMVQLFLTVESEPTFKEACSELQQRWGTETLTDTVYEAVLQAAQGDQP